MSEIYISNEKKSFPDNITSNQILLERLCFGKVPMSDWQPVKKSKNSTLRFATIVSNFLQESLEFEGVQFILTRNSWRNILQFANLDFLLIESVWEDCTGDWNLAQHPSSDSYKELLELLAKAKQYNIPTIYWQTGGKEYHDIYAPFAKHFDFVFCADPEECSLFSAEGIKAEYLPPCIQPALANPFKQYEYYDSIHWSIVFDGWKDLERKPELWNILSELTDMDFHIVESNALLFTSSIFAKSKVCPAYAPYLHGCISPEQRRTILKYTDTHITLSESINTPCRQRWLLLEAAACGALPLYHGSLAGEDVCHGIAIECNNTDRLLLELERCRQDPWYRKRLAHLAWRKVNMEHTFSHRVRTLCERIGIKDDWLEYPLISMITPTYRRENIESVINIGANQTYPHKEHIIITNGFTVPKEQQISSEVCPITYLSVPEENFAGACLNIGFQMAKGKYVYRIDDDDPYGENYILDTVLNNNALDIDFWGKHFKYIYTDKKEVLVRTEDKKPYCIGTARELAVAGHSFSGKKAMFQEHQFIYNQFGSADRSFLCLNVGDKLSATFDDFNLAAYRSDDITKHTWKSVHIDTERDPISFNEIMI